MTDMKDPTAIDIDAYIDDQLDPVRRIAVEGFLAGHPEIAARTMADLRARDELRMALAGDEHAKHQPATNDAARRLERGLRAAPRLRAIRRAAAIVMFVTAGWLANEMVGPLGIGEVVASPPPPDFVEEAVRAHRTTELRAGMRSQPEVPDFDPEELRSATAIVLPDLPSDWTVRDVQIYPSRFGPSVETALESDELGMLSLFAVRPGNFAVDKPVYAQIDGVSAAHFQIGEVAYVLVGTGDGTRIDQAAETLAATLY